MRFSCVAFAAHFFYFKEVFPVTDAERKQNVAKRLKYFRNLKGVSAKQMSLDIGKNEGYISMIENAKAFPSLEAFVDIVKYLGISCDFFMKANI